jgi:ABC-2 type transport system permease protein
MEGTEMKPLFYDFKRSFLRPATVLSLVAFIVIGVGLSYIVTTTLSTSGRIYTEGFGKIDLSNGNFIFYFNAYDANLKPLNSNVAIYLGIMNTSANSLSADAFQTLKSWTFKATNGFYALNDTINESVLSQIMSSQSTTNAPSNMVPGIRIQVSSSLGVSDEMIGLAMKEGDRYAYIVPFGGFSIIDQSGNMIGDVWAYLNKDELMLTALLDLPGNGFTFRCAILNSTLIPHGAEALNNTIYLGEANSGLNVYKLNLSDMNISSSSISNVYLTVEGPDGKIYSSFSLPIERVSTGRLQGEIESISTGSAGLALFSLFFPIVVLYIAYALIAKPKGMGALEFLLARPISRWDVYISRFTAGALTTLVSSAVFLLAFDASLMIITGYGISASHLVIIFLGILSSLLAFYSVCYMLSTVLGGSKYLSLSILLYLFFTMIYNIIIVILGTELYGTGLYLSNNFARLQYISYYFNPIGLVNFASYFIGRSLNTMQEISVVNPYLVAVSAILWIALPIVIGWLLFRKANLSR